MKIHSKPHIWPFLSGIIMICGCAFFGYVFFASLIIEKPIPFGLFIVLGLFTTLGVWTFILGIYFFKYILISSENISILYPFRLKKYRFKLSDIESHKSYINFGRFKNYESLHFQTSDKKLFMIMQYEYWNYKKIKDVIVNSSENVEINKYHNGRQLLIFLALSLILTYGTAGLIELMNQITK